jgi:hypothetical protein
MSLFAQVRKQPPIGALIDQESHTLTVAGSALFLAAAKASFLCRERR